MWEERTGKKFEDLVGELRRRHSPEEVIRILGVSRGFLYYHFGHAMDRIRYTEAKWGKPLGEVVAELREKGFRMTEVARELGLAATTLYNHLNKHLRENAAG